MVAEILRRAAVNHIDLPSGRRVGLPVLYRDWTGVMAHFPASAARMRRLLPSRKLKPALIAPGVAVLSIAAIEYRRVDGLAAYNEVAVMTPVLHRPVVNFPALPLLLPNMFRSLGFFVLHMPVTTADACELGKFWGYPKRLAEIQFEEIDNLRRCRLRADGMEALTLDVEQAPAKIERRSFRIYTVKDGRLFRHRIETEGLYGLSRLPGGGALALGDHPMARELRELGVGDRAIARVFASNVASLLHEADQSYAL